MRPGVLAGVRPSALGGVPAAGSSMRVPAGVAVIFQSSTFGRPWTSHHRYVNL
ncbi:MAG TPA: hypothetical protein VGD67_25645 [Pseudonocardiaceae bacterium]